MSAIRPRRGPARVRRSAARWSGSVLAFALASPLTLAAQVSADPGREPGSGRLVIEVGFVADVFGAAVGGGSRDPRYLDNLDLLARMDLGALGLRNTTIAAHVQSNRGGSLSATIGDFQGASNIEAPESWRLYELWIEHTPVPGRLSLLAGVFDLNAEFDVLPVAADFINSSFGFGPDYSTAGLSGPSTFPLTSWGARVSVRPVPFGYVAVSASDGAPGDPAVPERSRFALDADEGGLLAWEIGYGHEPGAGGHGVISRSRMGRDLTTKLAFGGWVFTRRFARYDGAGDGTSWGLYGLGQRRVLDSGSLRATAFGRVGLASAAVNRIGFYAGGGLAVRGSLASRPDDVLGAGIALARNGTPFLEQRRRAAIPTDRTETVLEFFYAIQFGDILRLQPDVQWIVNPGMDPSLENAIVVGGRGMLTISFP